MNVSVPTAVTEGPVELEPVSTRRVESASSSPMNDVPHDCLALIFTFLDPTTLLRTAPLVSRRFLAAWRSPVTFSFITAEIHAPQLLRKAGVSISDFAPPVCPIVAAKSAAKLRSKQQRKETRRALRNAERERRREQKQRFRKAVEKESSVSAKRHADASSVHDVAAAAISSGESRCPIFARAAAAGDCSAVSSGDVVAIGRAMMEHPQCPADPHRGAPVAVVSREVTHPASCPFSADESAPFNASRRNYCPLPPPSPTSRMPTQGATADGPCSNDSMSSAPPGGSFATSCAISFDTVKRPSNPDKFRVAAASTSASAPAATKTMAGKDSASVIPAVSLAAAEARGHMVHQDPEALPGPMRSNKSENAATENESVVALPLQPLYPPRLHPVETHNDGEDHYDSFDDESMPSPGFPPSAPPAVISPAIPSATMTTNAAHKPYEVKSDEGKTSAATAKKNTCTKPCCVNPRVLYVLVMRDFKMWPSRFCLPQLLRSVGTYRQVVSAIPEVARGLGRPYPLHKLPQDLTSPTLRALALCCGWWPTHAESETGGETTSVDATSQGSDDSSFSEAQDGTTLVRSQRRARNAALRARRLARLAARNEQHQSRSSASSAERHRAFFESETDDDDDSSMLTDSDSDYSSAALASNDNGGKNDHAPQEASDGECHPLCADQTCPLRSSRDVAADDDDDEAELSCSSECSCATCSCDMDEEDEQSGAVGEGSCQVKTVQLCDPLTCGQQSVTVAETVNKPSVLPADASDGSAQQELCCDVAVCSRRVKIIDYYEAKRERTAIRKCRTDDSGCRQTAAPNANAARNGTADDDEDEDDGGLPAGKLAPYRTVYACGTSSDDCCDGDEGSAGRTGRGCGGGCDGYMSDLSDECQVITSTCSAVADVESHALALERYKRRVELGQQSKDEEPPSPPSAVASQSQHQHQQSSSAPPQAQGDEERDGFVQSSTPHDGEKGLGVEPAGVMSPRRARHCRHQHSHGRAPASPSPPRCSHGSPGHAPSCLMHGENGNENGTGEASSPENSAAADSILTSPVQCHCRSCHHSSPTQSQPHHRHSSSCCHHHTSSHHSPRAHRTSSFPSSPTTLAQNDEATAATVDSATKQTVVDAPQHQHEERATAEEKPKIAEGVSITPAVSAPAVAAPSQNVQDVTHDDVPAERGADDAAAENHNSDSEEANAEDDDEDDEETRDLFFSPFGSHDVYHHIHGAQISIPERDDQTFLRCASFFFTIGLEPDERIRNDPTCNSEVLYCLFPPGVREVYHYHPVAPVAGVAGALPDESDVSGENGSSVEAPAARRGRESAEDVRRAFLGGVFDTDSEDETDSVTANDDGENDNVDNESATAGRTDENRVRTARPKHSGSTTPAPASGLSTTCIADLFARRARDVQSGRFTLRPNGLGLDLFPNWGPGTSTVTTNGVTVSLSVLCAMKNVESRLGGAPNPNSNPNQNSTSAGSASSTTSHLFIYRVRIHMGVRQRDEEFDVAASDDDADTVRAAPGVFGDAAGSDTVSFAPPRALTAAPRSVGAGASIMNTRGRAGATPPPASSSSTSTSTPTAEIESSAQGRENQEGQAGQDGRDREGASTEFSRILSVPRAERQYRNVSFISPLRTSSPSEATSGPPPAVPSASTDASADAPNGRYGDGRQIETATFSPVRTAAPSAGSSRSRTTEGNSSSRRSQQRRQRLMEEGVTQCQLVSRHWTIGDQTIRGPGVIGLYPVVRPLDEHAVPPYHEPKQQSLKSVKHSKSKNGQTSSSKPATVLSSSSKAVQDSVSRAFDAVFDDANSLGALNTNENGEKSRRDKKVDLLEEARMAMKAGLWHWTRHTEEGDGVFEYCSQTMEPDGTKFGGSLTFVPGTIDHPRGPEFSVEVGEVTLDSSVMAPL